MHRSHAYDVLRSPTTRGRARKSADARRDAATVVRSYLRFRRRVRADAAVARRTEGRVLVLAAVGGTRVVRAQIDRYT